MFPLAAFLICSATSALPAPTWQPWRGFLSSRALIAFYRRPSERYIPDGKHRGLALLTQFVLGVVFIFLGQAGTSVKGAYDVLVSMGVITYFIPYLYLFAAMIKLQGEAAGPDVIRVPGGKQVAKLVAIVGFCHDDADDRSVAGSAAG